MGVGDGGGRVGGDQRVAEVGATATVSLGNGVDEAVGIPGRARQDTSNSSKGPKRDDSLADLMTRSIRQEAVEGRSSYSDECKLCFQVDLLTPVGVHVRHMIPAVHPHLDLIGTRVPS